MTVRTPRTWSYKPVEIVVDGNVVGKVGWRRKPPLDLQVSPGRHSVAVRLGVLGSAPIDVQLDAGQLRSFEVRWSRKIGINADRRTNLVLSEAGS